MTELGRATTLEEIVDILIVRRKTLGLPQHVVDDLAGYADGYTGKIECGLKGLGKLSLPGLLGALGTEIAIMPAARQHRGKTGSDHENYWSRRGREMRKRQLEKQTPKQRKKIARAAAKARWRKVERERTA